MDSAHCKTHCQAQPCAGRGTRSLNVNSSFYYTHGWKAMRTNSWQTKNKKSNTPLRRKHIKSSVKLPYTWMETLGWLPLIYAACNLLLWSFRCKAHFVVCSFMNRTAILYGEELHCILNVVCIKIKLPSGETWLAPTVTSCISYFHDRRLEPEIMWCCARNIIIQNVLYAATVI